MHYVSMSLAATKPSAIAKFASRGGTLRMAEAMREGISRKALYKLRDNGLIEQVDRGLYRLSEMPPMRAPDLALVASRSPHAVVCLVSALAFHNLTTQVPHAVDIALERGTRKSRLAFPPTNAFWFSGEAFTQGIETHTLDAVPIRIYNPEKTIADCFRYRNKIGMDVVLEALRNWRQYRPGKFNTLMKYARIRHVETQLAPYLAVAP
jgi:predicted transcriptional regulator of viral defense system